MNMKQQFIEEQVDKALTFKNCKGEIIATPNLLEFVKVPNGYIFPETFLPAIKSALSACWDKSRQEALEELERKLPDKLTFAKGVMKMIFGDGRQDEIPVASNYDSGRTSYRNEIKELIKSMKI